MLTMPGCTIGCTDGTVEFVLRSAVARQRFERLPRERREAIISVSVAEFARHGFHGTSYNQLIERLELGKSSAYYYFEDKRDLFLTAVRHCYATFLAAVSAVELPHHGNDFWAFVEQISLRGYEFMVNDPNAAALMLCMQREKTLVDELGSSDVFTTMGAFYADMIRHGQGVGVVRSDLPPQLLLALVGDVVLTFDRWFVTARGAGSSAAAPEPSPAVAARLFTDAARRLCCPQR
jgi:AcrR family transcriptional regulator